MKKIDFKRLSPQQKLIAFCILSAVTGILVLIPLFYQVNSALTPVEKPIYPTNQKPTTSSQQTKETETSTGKTKPGTSKEVIPEQSGELEPINVILSAQEDKSEENNGESIKTYIIDKPIEKEGLVTTITNAAVAKLTKESMTAIGQKGEGLIDISFDLVNNTSEDIKIHPEDIMFRIDQKDYPLADTSDLKNTTLKKGEKLSGTLVTVLPTLKNSEAVKEISFTWKTTIKKVVQIYDVLIVLR